MEFFTDDEIDKWTNEYMNHYDDLDYEFEKKSSLTSLDTSILIYTAALQTARWAFLSHDKFRFDKASDADKYLDKARSGIKQNFPTVREIADSVLDHTVPYDATAYSPSYTGERDAGISGNNHRYTTLGHDPIAGLIVGTMNIATNTVTLSNFSSYVVVNQKIADKTDIKTILQGSLDIVRYNPENMAAALIRQVIHMGTDVFTKQGLPVPLVSTVSIDNAKFLTNNQIDLYSVTRAAALAICVNKIAEMIHKMYFNPDKDNPRIYQARTRKVLMYSNVLSSLLNVGYVGMTRDLRRLDVGGILVTLWRILMDRDKIRQLKQQFINDMLQEHYQRELNESRRELERLGIEAY